MLVCFLNKYIAVLLSFKAFVQLFLIYLSTIYKARIIDYSTVYRFDYISSRMWLPSFSMCLKIFALSVNIVVINYADRYSMVQKAFFASTPPCPSPVKYHLANGLYKLSFIYLHHISSV